MLTLTSDTTLKARSYSAAYSPSLETVAVFDSLIPEVPGESYISPAYIEILHATLDGSPAVVSMTGISGTTNGLALSDNLFILRYPLSATGSTPVTLHRSGIPDLATNILWREIDLAEYGRPDEMTLRLGESLLLTAFSGQTNGEVVITITDESGSTEYYTLNTAHSPAPVLFDQPGTFTVTATLDGISVGSMEVNVVYVNFDGPIACQVGYKREKGVEVFGPTNQVFFTAKDETILNVSVKEGTEYGVRLYLKPKARGTPVVQARLGSATGPILAEQEIDEFTVDSSAALHVVVNGATGIGNTELKMKPWIPDIDVNCAMFANYSTFAGGATEYSLNTSDFSAQNINGDPAVELVVDPSTGETQATIRVDFEIPPDEDSYCFQAVFDQHSKYGSVIAEAICNGTPDVWELTDAYWGEDQLATKPVTAKCVTGHDPAKPHAVVSAETGFEVENGAIACEQGASYTVNIKKTAVKEPGKYNLKIETTDFAVLNSLDVDIAPKSDKDRDVHVTGISYWRITALGGSKKGKLSFQSTPTDAIIIKKGANALNSGDEVADGDEVTVEAKDGKFSEYKLNLVHSDLDTCSDAEAGTLFVLEIDKPVELLRANRGKISAQVKPASANWFEMKWKFTGGLGGEKDSEGPDFMHTSVILVDGTKGAYTVKCSVKVHGDLYTDSAPITVKPRTDGWSITPTCKVDADPQWGDYPIAKGGKLNVEMGRCTDLGTVDKQQIIKPFEAKDACTLKQVDDANGPNHEYWYIESTIYDIKMQTLINKYITKKNAGAFPDPPGVGWYEHNEAEGVDVAGHWIGVGDHEYQHFEQLETQEAKPGMDARTVIEDNFHDPVAENGIGAKEVLLEKTDLEVNNIRGAISDAAKNPEPSGHWTGTILVYDDSIDDWEEIPRNP